MDHATRRRVAATYGTGVFVSRRRPHELSALASVLPAAAHNTATTQLVYSLCDAPGHASPEHPECPARIAAITAALRHGLLDQHPAVRQLPRTTSTAAAEAGLALVHPPAYLRRLQELCGTLQAPTMIDDATYMAPRSYDAACEAAGAVLDVLDAVLLAGQRQQHQEQQTHSSSTMGFCLVRPPGHHVLRSRPMGFGLVNLVSMAAAAALQHPGIDKVLLLDFDVHHGNGSEDMFWESRQVLYVSTHQAGLWPYTGKLTSTGGGEWGRGYTINVPLPGDAGHASVLAVWDAVIEPAARRFRPDIVLVSLGFDAHVLDPLASLQFREATYHALCQRTAQLARELCGGRCVWVLEGGYHEASLSASVVSSFLGALGVEEASAGEAAAWLRPEPEDKVNAVIQAVQRMHGL